MGPIVRLDNTMRKEYGPHQYPTGGLGECEHGCGCQMERYKSGGPVGINPFPAGPCPGNPLDGMKLGGEYDWAYVVEDTINKLNGKVGALESQLKAVSPGEVELARQLSIAESKNSELRDLFHTIDRDFTEYKDRRGDLR